MSDLNLGSSPPEVTVVCVEPVSEAFLALSLSPPDIPSDGSSSGLVGELLEALGMIQVRVRVRYTGDLHATVSTEICVNVPTPNFITLPLSLTLTSLDIDGEVIVVVRPDGSVLLSLENVDDAESVLRDVQLNSLIGDTSKRGTQYTISSCSLLDFLSLCNPLTHIRMYLYSLAALQNVETVKHFIVSQLRDALEKHLLYPRFIALPVSLINRP